ncbi:putative WPP domain-associated protein [Helianthus annuus]|nr:putative WPP domain-associated protein [Helianthus annuus]KAJ0493175.1 putative WPP domain-associated protein [Helianthus annuus]KAJ0505259.1 putative WPP domain-associated protein [Helianthus annuus]KAJ0674941.1 putative WPP domain-associated protein [Helianthus annuus]
MQFYSTFQTQMECKNQTDSILMTLLRTAMDETHKKIRSITGAIECLNETSKFYELAIIQIDAGLKLVVDQPEDQTPKTIQKKMLTDLTRLKHLLHERLNDTKRMIIKKDKALMERLETEIRLKQHVMIKQMNSDVDMLKERLDRALEQIHRSNEVRHLDQQWRGLIEKETILIVIKGYIDAQSIVCSKKDAIIARVLEQRQQSAFQTMTMEEHYMVLLNDSYKDFQDYDIETNVREDVFVYVFMDVVNDMRIKFDFELQKIQSEVLEPLVKDFQENVNEKLHTRLDGIKQRIDLLSRQAVSIRKEEMIYKKAFTRRCQNLLLAETEVDLLGDQVEALQDLLQKIYLILDQHSSVLSQNFQVTDILKMIKKELNGLIITT